MLLTLKLNQYGIGLDSAIYASVARNIAEGGNWLSPTYTEFYHTQFAEHPPLALWMLALVFKLFGANDVTARLVSIFTGWGSILLVYAIGCRMLDRRFGFIAAGMLLLTFNYISISTKTFLETPFFFFILLSLWGLLYADQERRLAGWIIFAIGLGAAMLVKGIVIAGYLAGLFSFLIFEKRDLLKNQRFWLFSFIGMALPAAYCLVEEIWGRNHFAAYYFGFQIWNRAWESQVKTDYLCYAKKAFNLYWPWLPFLLYGIYLGFSKRHAWNRLMLYIVLAYALFHSLSYRLNWQYFANLYVFGAFVSAWAWHHLKPLDFPLHGFKKYFLPFLLILYIILQASPVRVHEMRDRKLVSLTPYAERIFQKLPRRLLFTKTALGDWSPAAKIKWYWRAEARFVSSVSELDSLYRQDGNFSFAIVDQQEIIELKKYSASGLMPMVRSGNLVLVVSPQKFQAGQDQLLNAELPRPYWR